MSPHLTFHHFGLAARRPDEARKFIAALGYQLGGSVFDPAQNVHLQLGTHTRQPAVEIIWPGDSSGPVDKLVGRHPSGIIYHLCYETDNLTAALAGLEAAGLRPLRISPPTPAPLFGGRAVSFYNVVGMGLVEILE
jgi:catechol 2,3-dioxygenase-like lactoylglutathione lyase family enzyme